MPWRIRIVGHADVPPGDLVANPDNWRRHPRRQRAALTSAIAEVGLVAGAIVNRRSDHLLDGHLRVEEAFARGEPWIPVTYVDLSPDEERLVLATFDPIGAMADADAVTLERLLADLTPTDSGLTAMLEELARGHGLPRPGRTDPDDAPPLPELADVDVRPGDLFELGAHLLVCGDATDPATVARVTGDELVACTWTDPPWGVGYTGKTRKRLTIDNDDPGSSDAVLQGALRLVPVEPNARFYIAAPSGTRLLPFLEAIEEVGWRFREELIWSKGRIAFGRSDWQPAHESILYGHAPGPGRPGRGRHPGTKWYGDHRQSTILAYPKPAASRLHPTSKPVGLVAQCLANSTALGDLVYEPFAGSGSTLLAAEMLARRCAAVEIDPRYAQVTIDRFEAFTGTKAVRRG